LLVIRLAKAIIPASFGWMFELSCRWSISWFGSPPGSLGSTDCFVFENGLQKASKA